MQTNLRWVRRRNRNRHLIERRQRAELLSFQVMLLGIIFFIWVLGARILAVHAITTLPCGEMVADFGAGAIGVPVFQLFFYICLLLAGLWIIITLSYWRVIRKNLIDFLHLVLLLLIAMLGVSFRLLHIPENIPPDGTLGVEHMVWDRAQNKLVVLDDMTPKWGEWIMGQSDISISPRCVWLERGLITGDRHVPYQPYRDLLSSYNIKPWVSLNDVHKSQNYRPLTEAERDRFLRQKACMASYPKNGQRCEFGWVFNNFYIHGETHGAFYP